jgi:dihydroflavonol-4-reductase
MKEKVLVTGISGFLGSHTAIKLLEKGYRVTGTLRELKRADELRKTIAGYTGNIEDLTFAQAELSDENVWLNLTKGVDYIQHIASPFPSSMPKNDDELVVPAKAGVLNILKAASANSVKRVVLTSAASTVLHGKPKGHENGTYDETVWADENNLSDTTPYYRSKIIAEKAAWDFTEHDDSGLQLVSVLPGAMLGPALEQDYGTSAAIVLKMLDGSLPAIPQISFDIADVRSVADLLILAMEKPEASNQRFLATSGFLSMKDIAEILRQKYPDRKIPSGKLPIWLTHVLGWFDKSIQPVLLDLGKERKADSSKARNMLGWKPIDKKEAVLACAESLISLRLIK